MSETEKTFTEPGTLEAYQVGAATQDLRAASLAKHIIPRRPGEVVKDPGGSGETVHATTDRPHSNEDRLNQFLQMCRDHRSENPDRNGWRVAVLAGERVDDLTRDVVTLESALLRLHLPHLHAYFKQNRMPEEYPAWGEIERLVEKYKPRLVECWRHALGYYKAVNNRFTDALEYDSKLLSGVKD